MATIVMHSVRLREDFVLRLMDGWLMKTTDAFCFILKLCTHVRYRLIESTYSMGITRLRHLNVSEEDSSHAPNRRNILLFMTGFMLQARP
jgi:hypothetical protein